MEDDLFEIDLGGSKSKKKKINKEEPKQILEERKFELVKYSVSYYINYIEPLYFDNTILEFEIEKGQIPDIVKLVEELKRLKHRELHQSLIKIQNYQKIETDERPSNKTVYGFI